METFLNQLTQQFQLPLQNPVLVFALILLIILLAPILLRKFRIPSIIGLILAGIVVGPFGLNLLARNEAVDLFSTVGILYLMFLTGLDLEITGFRKHALSSGVFGVMTFLFPFALGFPVCHYLLKYDLLPSILLASMFSAHTLIAYPVVTKFGISRNGAVAATVGGTIITDTAVLLVLAAVTGSRGGDLNTGFWLRIFISMAIFLAVMFQVVPRIARWFFLRLEGEKTSHFVFVLAVVFLSAFLSQLAGLEPIIGAFVAGLALNRFIPSSSALMNRIQFVGNALFIPFFLISVGMLIDLRSLFHGPAVLVTALAIIVVALAGKYLAARMTQLIFRFTATEGLLIFGLSSSRVAATMAVVLVGYQAGIVDKTILEATILLILFSCLVAAIVTERAARDLVRGSEDRRAEMEGIPRRRESILIPVAWPGNLESLMEMARYIHDRVRPEPVRILSVIPEDGDPEGKLRSTRLDLERRIAGMALQDLETLVVVKADPNAPSCINRVSREWEVTTLLLGWPGRETLSDRLFGQKTDLLIGNSERFILVCRLLKPLNTYARITLFCPPLSESEPGFDYLITKMTLLSAELGCPIQLFAEAKTREAVRAISDTVRLRPMKTYDFRRWEYFDLLLRRIAPDDLSVILVSRRGAVSHHPAMDHLVERLNNDYPQSSVILAYPMTENGDEKYDRYSDFYSEPVSGSMETVRNIRRGLEKMIHKAE